MTTTRRDFLKKIGIGATSSALPFFLASCRTTGPRPNILFIMSDDHASHAISCYGSRINKTPNIDRLAGDGMRFNRMTVTNSLCAPSRASLLTGKFSHENGFLQNGYSFDGEQQTFPQLLQRAGCETAIIGKWHLKSEPTGFDYFNVIPGHGRFFDCPFKEKGKKWRDGVAGGEKIEGYLTDVITDLSIGWLEKRRSEKPFCLMVHHKAPHAPHDVDEKHSGLYDDVKLPEPPTLDDDWNTRLPAASATGSSKMADCDYPEYAEFVREHSDRAVRTREMYQIYMKGYLQLVASLDDNIGRLLDYIDSSGLRANTIVIYTSDNGFFLGDHGFFNKMWMYEQSLHIPLIVRYPKKIEPGSVSDEMVQNIDFAPTLLDYAGAGIPDDMQGRSFRSILKGSTPADWRDKVYYHYYEGYNIPEQYGVRTKNHKLICYPEFEGRQYRELFDLNEDPMELKNVHSDPAYARVLKRLEADLAELRARYGDTDEVKGPRQRLREIEHLAKDCPVSLVHPPSPKYSGGSESPLTDGIVNNISPRWAFHYERWLGFEADDLDATVDLGKRVKVNQITARFLQKHDSWIFPPTDIRMQVSPDGSEFTDIDVVDSIFRAEGGVAYLHLWRGAAGNRATRYIRVHAKNIAICPDWHPGAGRKAWLFIDEIIAE
jgi:arylsulfatase A-like enzyme